MRQIVLLYILAALPAAWLTGDARAQSLPRTGSGDVLYRCESADGISIQGKPCPKGAAQRKITVLRPADAPASPATPATPPTQAAARDVPQAPPSAMHGPNDSYPLWQCMRADGSTFDSRNGVPGKQWVVKPDSTDAAGEGTTAPAKITTTPKGLILRPIEQTAVVAEDAPTHDLGPAPPGAVPGQWVADQCVRLETQQACERFATRRDALRKLIYAAKPSERATWAPEEQDLTSMLFAACGR